MFVYLWCVSLCARFHCSGGDEWSQSQVEEWILGSRIQSHWPCRTLCPISMLSRILASARPAVPATHAVRLRLRGRVGRPPSRPGGGAGQGRGGPGLEQPLELHDAADVRRVPLAAAVEHLLADRVQL